MRSPPSSRPSGSGAPSGAIVMVAAAILLGAGVGGMALLDPDEGRYAAASRSMLRSGDLVVPVFNGEPRLNKPPLVYWMQAGAMALIGEGETAARIPSVLCALLCVALTGWWARRRLGGAPGADAAAVAALVTTPIFFACARIGIPDMPLALGTTGAILFWHEAAIARDPRARMRFGMAAAIAAGLAVLAKGPVGAILPALVILATAGVARRPGLITARGIVVAVAGIVLVAGPWAAALSARVGAGTLAGILQREMLQRAVGGLDHPRPFHYLLVSFWATFAPWSSAAAWAIVRRRPVALSGTATAAGPLTGFLIAWIVVVLGFFTLVADKNDAYLLPAAPAVALVSLRAIGRRAAIAIAAGTGALLLAAALLMAPVLSRGRSLKEAVVSAGLAGGADLTALAYRIDPASLVFYADRPVRILRSGRALQEALEGIPEEASVAIVMTRARYASLQPEKARFLVRFEESAGQKGYVVLRRPAQPP